MQYIAPASKQRQVFVLILITLLKIGGDPGFAFGRPGPRCDSTEGADTMGVSMGRGYPLPIKGEVWGKA